MKELFEQVADEVITDADYQVRTVTHKLWPVSYINDRGEQVDCLYSWRPLAKEYYVGEPFTVEAQHPIGMEQTALEGKIASLKEQLAYLEAKNA